MLKTVWIVSLVLIARVRAFTRPPGIFYQADYDVFYKAGETVELPCVAEGVPRPTYTWKRNGIDFNPAGNDDRVVQLSNVGTIVITKPEDKDEGIFQCFAQNNYGTSLSININLREAKLKDFEVGPDTRLYPQLGQPVTLNCVPPESIPQPQVFWVIKKPYGGFDAINADARVTMDHEYRLRITNVKPEDYAGGRAYACMALNNFMRKTTQGPQFFINPQGATEELRPVSYMWASPEDHFGLRGDDFRVKCIFSGNPTPDVHWVRTDGYPLPDRAKITSFGMEMIIEDLHFEDAGVYECWATNTNTQTRVQRTISVRVESSPYWLLEPKDVEIGVGGTAEFNCLARAVPEPQYFWFVNGKPLNQLTDDRLTPDRFRRPRPDRIVITNVNREDPMVIQCNATNKHGYIWGDSYLNVLSEAPTIIDPPQPQQVVAEGTHINVTCHVTGKPDPIITWYKDNQQITGGRYKILPTGDLNIRQVVLSDAGKYTCEARNIFNTTSAEGVLLVRRKTMIEQAPLDLEVIAGYDAKFTCSATTDPEEVDNLKIIWLKDNKEISTIVQRMTTNYQDNSLTISGTIVRDSGSYTCIATNGLDQAEASAMLMVKDRPDAPSKVEWTKCQDGANATVVWMPGSYNNAPVQYYIIQYNTSFNPDTWTFGVRVDSIYNTANVSLSPWVNYTFRVIAYNKIGESDPSFPTPRVCRTKDSVPYNNPRNLRTIGDRPDYLHIEWTAMPQMEHNGLGFQYILQVRREGFPDQVEPIYLNEWRTYEYFYNTPNQIYEPYEITLRAANGEGSARQDPSVIRGFTGEAIPTRWPENLRAVDIQDTTATLEWDFPYEEITNIPTQIRGEFRGFKIQFWQQGYKRDTLREWNMSPEDALENRVGNVFTTTVEDLLPFTNMEANVAVMNNYYISQPSDIIRFKTAAGFPGPVELFREINIGDNHVNLEWKPPEENRGDILGYDIGYQSVKGLDLGEIQERDPQVEDPYTTTAMLSGLLTSTKYRVFIWARTEKGRGEGYFIEIVTTAAGDPQAPRFTITDVGQHYINVSWWINPYASSGTVVYVEYRKIDGAVWLRTTDEVLSSWKNITDLEAGTTYEIRVVSTNGGVRRASHIEEVTTRGIALASALIGNWGWFLGMMLALMLLIGLIIFFVILFRRGVRFKQQESPSNSYYGGDTPVAYSGTYADNTSRFPGHSSDFGPEPRGYHNDYYDERDHDDYPNDKKGSYHDDRDYDDRRDDYRDDYYDKDRHPDDRDYNRRYDRDYDRDDYDRKGRDDRDYHDYEGYHGEDRYRPPQYNGHGRDRYTSDDHYEDYDRKPSGSYDPDYNDRDYREPDRFDKSGTPVDHRSRSSSSGGGAAPGSSTFV